MDLASVGDRWAELLSGVSAWNHNYEYYQEHANQVRNLLQAEKQAGTTECTLDGCV